MNSFPRLCAIGSLIAAAFLNAAIGAPATLALGDLTQTYDGSPKVPTVVTDPPGLGVSLRYVDPSAPAPLPVVDSVYNNIPSPLASSYSSLGFSSQQTAGLGDRVQLAGTARELTSVDVVLVSWAKAATYPELSAANAAGWYHPVKLSVFDMDSGGSLTLRSEITNHVFIPWRPLTQPNGQPYTFNGYAFLANFEFPAGLILPEQPVFMVSFNTASSGFEPIGAPGPYNELNVASGDGPSIGTDPNSAASLWVRNSTTWIYPAIGTKPPMFIVKARRTPEPGTTVPPTNSGTWQVTARVTNQGYEGEATATFSVQPATAQVLLGDLTRVADGNPKEATATTVPSGLSVVLSYDGSPSPPSALGRYAVIAVVQNPNYVGSADGELWLGHSLDSWLAPWVQNQGIPAGETGDLDDPDRDSINNLLEYALGLDPSSPGVPEPGGNSTPVPALSGQSLSIIYRKNLTATDLQFQVQTATSFGDPADWQPATVVETVLATVGSVQTIRAALAPESNPSHRFLRLSVTRR